MIFKNKKIKFLMLIGLSSTIFFFVQKDDFKKEKSKENIVNSKIFLKNRKKHNKPANKSSRIKINLQCKKNDHKKEQQQRIKKIENIFKEKIKQGYDKELLKWFIVDTELETKSSSLSYMSYSKEEEKIDNWYYHLKQGKEYYKAFLDNNLQSGIKIVEEIKRISPNKEYLKRFSQSLYEHIGLMTKKEIENRMQFLEQTNLPIDPLVIIFYPAETSDELMSFARSHHLEKIEITKTNTLSLLEKAAYLNKPMVLDYLLNNKYYKPDRIILSKALKFALMYQDETELSIFKSLLKHGARATINSRDLVKKLLGRYKKEGLENYFSDIEGQNVEAFPFDQSLKWQFEELINEINSVNISSANKDAIKESHCFSDQYGINQDIIKTVNKIVIDLENQGMSEANIEQSLTEYSKRYVEAFRSNIKIKNKKCKNKMINRAQMKNISEHIKNGDITLSDCIYSSSLINILDYSYQKYFKNISLNELLDLIPTEPWNKFDLAGNGIVFVLKNIETFDRHGWDIDFIDENFKGFFYYAIKFQNFKAAQYLIQKKAPINTDPYGWDALDYFLIHFDDHKHPEKWLNIFLNHRWVLDVTKINMINDLIIAKPTHAKTLNQLKSKAIKNKNYQQ